jgi:hypothetical protein
MMITQYLLASCMAICRADAPQEWITGAKTTKEADR